MNVRMAAQTLSESVANSMQFLLEQGHPNFLGAEGTIDFIRKMNTLFDIFNTRHKQNQNIFKRAINPDNKRIVFDYFKTCIDYFRGLKIEDESKKRKDSLITSRRKTAFEAS